MADDSSVQDILRDGNNKFTANMFYEVVKSHADKSVVLSAFSVMPPLAQLGLASVGESHDEILESIGMPNDNITKEAFTSINSQVLSTKGVQLKTASKIYVAKDYELNPEFAAVTRDVFGSEIQSIDFVENQKASDEINAWVESKTNDKIHNLVSPDMFSGDSRMLLANAIYFKGFWKTPFKKYATVDRDFSVSKKRSIKIPTMFNDGEYKFVENKKLGVQIIEIPYEGNEASFIIVLPKDVDGINSLENTLKDPAVLENALKDLKSTEVDVFIPKFKIETTTDLQDVLEKMGVTKMFSKSSARLDYLIKNTKNLYVSSAIQKALIEINEEGAEAAAANVFGIVATSLIIKPPSPVFKADRPFYYAIRANGFTIFNGVFRGE